MHQLKLTYFDIHGGRGEPARLALLIGGIDFEDFRFPFSQFPDIKKTTPLGQVPTLEIDGHVVTQSNSINRFVGKLTDLYPQDNLHALLCDEIMDAIEDATSKIVATFPLQGDEQKAAREALAAGPLTHYLQWVQSRLAEQGGEFFVGNKLSMADLKVFVWINSLNSGKLDHFPTDLVAKAAPKLNEHMQLIAKTPAIAAHYAA